MTPKRALARLGAAARGVRIVRCLHRAATKRVWLAERRGERLILRVDEAPAHRLELDRPAELQVLQLVAEAGVGPEVLAADTAVPAVLLLRYVTGRSWTIADLHDRRHLGQLAALLRRVHAIPVPGPALDLDAVVHHYQRLAGIKPMPDRGKELGHSMQHQDLIIKKAMKHAMVSLCHHDPIAANIVGFRQPRLIDWEYAAGGDPLFDLAVVIRHHQLPAPVTRYFLSAYFGGAGAVPREAIAAREVDYERIAGFWKKALALCNVTLASRKRCC